MNMSVRYCIHCGKPLSAEARFCGRCGRPVKPMGIDVPVAQTTQVQTAANSSNRAWEPAPAPLSQPPAPVVSAPVPVQPPAPIPSAELIVGTIAGAARKKGFLGMSADYFTLVVTDRRIIFATQTTQMMQENTKRARESAKTQGKNFLGQWGAVIHSNNGQHYLQMPAEAVVGENPGNFSLYHNQIRSVKFNYYSDEDNNASEYRMTLDTVSGKINLVFNMLDEKQAKQVLKQVLPNAVR
jgi:hypothetical protein